MNRTYPTLLIVDDDAAQRSLLSSFLQGQGFSIASACSGEEALAMVESKAPAMLISDVRMPGISGLELLGRIHEKAQGLPVLLVTAYADVRDAVGAMRDGAVDYLEKPIDLDELLHCVCRTLGIPNGKSAAPSRQYTLPDGIVSQSANMNEVIRVVELVAPSETRVLITGESGTGKEVVADLIHLWSPRASGPFVKVNCAAIPETLLESELFGHEKGAFTGASRSRMGRFEEADNGVIFLDEISEMSPALQAKLLRVTQDGTFHHVGSNVERRTNARILAATNKNMEEEVKKGAFREDLFYRLNVIEIYVPPLRQRHADIPALAHLFASQFAEGKVRFSPVAMTALELYAWPGNVRELRNAMERAVLLSGSEVILPEHLPDRIRPPTSDIRSFGNTHDDDSRMENFERAIILHTLREHDYNRVKTAKALGISRRALTYKLRAYRDQGYAVDPE